MNRVRVLSFAFLNRNLESNPTSIPARLPNIGLYGGLTLIPSCLTGLAMLYSLARSFACPIVRGRHRGWLVFWYHESRPEHVGRLGISRSASTAYRFGYIYK